MRNEADTRAELIDPKLQQAGWGVTDQAYIRREVICPGRIMLGGQRAKPVSSDYVLVYKNRKLAVVEAKKEALSYSDGVRQAKDYATRLNCRFAYATNGHVIYQIDMATGEEKQVDRFLSPETLWQITFDETAPSVSQAWRLRFSEVGYETKSGSWLPRYYQENAINAVLDAIAKGKNRILLTLATGTGKTSISFQTSWKLFHSKWSLSAQNEPALAKRRPRILFLADRNILAKQAFNDFNPFGEDALKRIAPHEIKKDGGVPKNASVFFTIFQTFMSGGQDEQGNDTPYFGDYPKDFFDLIIIDECHRGGANDESSWRAILDYFSPAVQLGLTATPKRTENADTYGYFGDPVYSYTLKQGIDDGFLTPFKVMPIVGTMDEYVYNPSDGLVVKGEPEPGKLYKEGDFNRLITIPAREQKRVEYWMDQCNPHEKTIVFCATQEHAGLVRDRIQQYAVKRGWTTNPNYCVRITATDGVAGENDLKIFQDNEKTIPTVLTTSRKLSTGVDARNVRNIVLMRPCNNMIEFKQIIGRGTRLYDGKAFFTIYDFVKAHHNFADPDWDGEPAEVTEPTSCEKCGELPCVCNKTGEPEPPCYVCGQQPCVCSKPKPEPCPECGQRPCVCNKIEKVVLELSDGKSRQIKFVSTTLYWGPDGKPISAKEFLERMFDDLPRFFKNEDELRSIWRDPITRDSLLDQLAEAGYDKPLFDQMKALIEAEQSDVYDVLAYVAFASEVYSRHQRVERASREIQQHYTSQQQAFINFILNQYELHGVEQLSVKNMKGLLELKYNSLPDALAHLGSIPQIRETFVSSQGYLYEQ
ncbi:EcoAI/FtnUII family type I restriction enzme subunit R [Thiomicrospira cyclica]|uniref:Type I site-specific deoxyribonuclease n=1 Tax=Thiomicrospira cyclica (strain DSM 14477 / JCM 11371 / ALM1) TaxID=717773 RepID=F6D9T4_THICA|nr:type I restriction endonuclease subunit R [Thiomicrospira cyclica]AEG32133.1 Type I site-specific deoxyribonuclease [Thiomicrospira cyclica ALM1]